MSVVFRRSLAALAVVALAATAFSAQDESVWVPDGIKYWHESEADSVAFDETVLGSIQLDAAIHNWTSGLVPAPVLELAPVNPQIPMIDIDPGDFDFDGSTYRWSFEDMDPWGQPANVWASLHPDATGYVPFEPGFTISRAISPTGLTHPGGLVTATIEFTLMDDSWSTYRFDGISFMAWGVFPWEDPEFEAYPVSVSADPWIYCDISGQFASCFSDQPLVGQTYTVDIDFVVNIDDDVAGIEWMPEVLGDIFFTDHDNEGGTFSNTWTSTNDYGVWTWRFQEPEWLHYQPARHKLVRLTRRSSSWDTITVDVDIKPGSDPASINRKSKGVIPVAILGSPEFLVHFVDPSTAVFGPGGATPAHGGHLEDVNGDGYPDLVLHFRTRDADLAGDATEACVSAETTEGQGITGCDAVRIVK